jgi:hypothetical protein
VNLNFIMSFIEIKVFPYEGFYAFPVADNRVQRLDTMAPQKAPKETNESLS